VRYILDRNACLLPAYFVINEVHHYFKLVTEECNYYTCYVYLETVFKEKCF